MSYIIINTSNMYDPVYQAEYATVEEADAKVREILGTSPQYVLKTAQLLKTYRATVTVVSEEGSTAPSAA